MDCDYADDLAVLDSTKNGLEESTDLICKYTSYAALRVNVKKTECIGIAKNSFQRSYTEAASVTVDSCRGSKVQQVSQFTYLGSVTSCDGRLDAESNLRIRKGFAAFNCLGKVWYNRNMLACTKVRIYRAAALTVLLYGLETWTTTKSQLHQMEVFYQRCLRRILRIKWYNKVSNGMVLQRAYSPNERLHSILSVTLVRPCI